MNRWMMNILLTVAGCLWLAAADAESLSFEELIGGQKEVQSETSAPNNTPVDGNVFERVGKAVGLVVIVTPDNKRIPHGTAWGVAPGVFATNAHVAEDVAKHLGTPIRFQVHMNNSATKIYEITAAKLHPAYDSRQHTFDVAILRVARQDNPVLPIADEAQLKALSAGMEIALVGYPMEQLQQGNVNLQRPIASVQRGNIVAISDYDMKDGGYANNHMIRHSVPATGGASGSPLFGDDGVVVGLLNAGNITQSLHVVGDGKQVRVSPRRSPSAALINFGVRVDLIRDLL